MAKHSQRPLRAYSFEKWKEILDAWTHSDLSRSEFCKQQELTRSSFDFWERRVAFPESFQTKARVKYTPEQRQNLIEGWKESSLSRHAYCVQKNITPSAFNKWISNPELQESLPTSKDDNVTPSSFVSSDFPEGGKESSTAFFQEHFVSVPLDPSTTNHSSCSNQKIEVVFAEGHRLCLQGPFDLELLGSWLAPLLSK